jgi:uncharacterized membrane protein YfcA
VLGTRLGTRLLDRLADHTFRQVSGWIILALGLISMIEGLRRLLAA